MLIINRLTAAADRLQYITADIADATVAGNWSVALCSGFVASAGATNSMYSMNYLP